MKHSIIFSIAKPLFSPFKHKKWFKGFLISVVPKFGSVNLKDLAWIEANWGVKIIYTYYEIEQLEREYKKKSFELQQQAYDMEQELKQKA